MDSCASSGATYSVILDETRSKKRCLITEDPTDKEVKVYAKNKGARWRFSWTGMPGSSLSNCS